MEGKKAKLNLKPEYVIKLFYNYVIHIFVGYKIATGFHATEIKVVCYE